MSFGGSSSGEGASATAFKKFVTEEEIEEKKRIRQEEWEKVRKPDEPLEAPEEKWDGRCLFDKLQEQKQKKQDEFDEQHRLSNQVKGLDDDEAQFLDFVSNKQMEITKKREDEETEIIQEYRSAVMNQVTDRTKIEEPKLKPSSRPAPATSTTGKKSQLSLLSGAVKRKSQDAAQPLATEKKLKTDGAPSAAAVCGSSSSVNVESTSPDSTTTIPHSASRSHQVAQVVGVLPGLGCYDNSSDSDSDSSDSDIELPGDIFQKKVVAVCQSNS